MSLSYQIPNLGHKVARVVVGDSDTHDMRMVFEQIIVYILQKTGHMVKRPVGYFTSEHVLEVISCSLAKYPTGYRTAESRSLLSTTQPSGEPRLSEKGNIFECYTYAL
ncbi:hypothetical protein AVEN_81195-1 [Araneus ventricosus]|uniref:Uncharacterized protein n=1 Tax=Araneus ventricosus TaxID=182803 RepID=A0A4Y1ZUB2_ARAVE|nr:hypothetical protein AVEN_81195-1 [Araneus ventricosus]